MIGSKFLKHFACKNEDMPPAGISTECCCREKSPTGRRVLTQKQISQQSQLRTSSTGIMGSVDAKVPHRTPSPIQYISHLGGAGAIITEESTARITGRQHTPQPVRPIFPKPEGIRQIHHHTPLRRLSELGPDPAYVEERPTPPIMIKRPLKRGVRMVPEPVHISKGYNDYFRYRLSSFTPGKRCITPQHYERKTFSKRHIYNNASQICDYVSIHAQRQRGIYCGGSPRRNYNIII